MQLNSRKRLGRLAPPVARRLIMIALTLICSISWASAESDQTLQIRDLAPSPAFANALKPGTLRLACARSVQGLKLYLESRGRPFDSSLVRKESDGFCHIDYEPTIAGFRADPDNYPAKGLFGDVNSLSFLARREASFGDALDIVKVVVRNLDRPVPLTLGVSGGHDDHTYRAALDFHFGSKAQYVAIRDNGGEAPNPWVQDYLKSGEADGTGKVLVTRHLYEGLGTNATAFQPLLNSFDEDRFVRSNLAWEGGDLQFVVHPEDPTRRLLLYGETSWRYWGPDLTGAEVEYVLKLEFGADELLEMSDPASHVDYFVTLLPKDGIALVAEPVRENQELARAAVALLYQVYGNGPHQEILGIARELGIDARRFREQRHRIRELLLSSGNEAVNWDLPQNTVLLERMQSYIAQNCSQRPEDCFTFEGQVQILDSDVNLLQSWVSASLEEQDRLRLAPCLLAVIESQLPGFEYREAEEYERKARTLAELGFRVIRVPRIAGDSSLRVPWAGISYANSLVVDRQIFVPVLGLGLPETRFLDRLQADLPDYQVIPVFARHMILNNGGVHCSLAVTRSG